MDQSKGSDLARCSLKELFAMTRLGGQSCPEARAAFTEICRRHADEMRSYCVAKHRRALRGDQDASAFVYEVFGAIWERALRGFDPSVAEDEAGLAKLFRCWFKTQAEWMVRERLRQRRKERSAIAAIASGRSAGATTEGGAASPEDGSSQEDFASLAVVSEAAERLDAEIARLNPVDLDLFRTCYRIYDFDSRQTAPDAEVFKRLMSEHSIPTEPALRKRLSRIRQRLIKAMGQAARVA